MDAFSIKGQTGIVTGGGKGLGRIYCHLLSEAGANVVVAEIDEETGQEAAESTPNSLYIHTDVTDMASVESMLETALSKYGRIDFLVNNAGKWTYAPAEDLTQEDWHDVIDLNLNGVFNCCQVVGRQMIAQRSGRIVNISSISGIIINKPVNKSLDVSYFASKAGVIHLSRSLATQWAQYNVRVNVLAPGYMAKTPINDAPWLRDIPMGRAGKPEELGPALIFLVSEASSYITGTTVVVDGGFTLW
jgi:NAD(P)-dependent dehydrogenase (short-subunit alcohol dehydrogenase family)